MSFAAPFVTKSVVQPTKPWCNKSLVDTWGIVWAFVHPISKHLHDLFYFFGYVWWYTFHAQCTSNGYNLGTYGLSSICRTPRESVSSNFGFNPAGTPIEISTDRRACHTPSSPLTGFDLKHLKKSLCTPFVWNRVPSGHPKCALHQSILTGK